MSTAKNAAAVKGRSAGRQRRIMARAPDVHHAAGRRAVAQCRQGVNGGSLCFRPSASERIPPFQPADGHVRAPAARLPAPPPPPARPSRAPCAHSACAHTPGARVRRARRTPPERRRTHAPPSPEAASGQPAVSHVPGRFRQPRVRVRQYAVAPAAAVLFEQRVRPLQPRQRPALSRLVVQPGLQRRRAQPDRARRRDRSIMRPCHRDPSVSSAAQSVSISMAGERSRS